MALSELVSSPKQRSMSRYLAMLDRYLRGQELYHVSPREHESYKLASITAELDQTLHVEEERDSSGF